jgi:hypothetical protein
MCLLEMDLADCYESGLKEYFVREASGSNVVDLLIAEVGRAKEADLPGEVTGRVHVTGLGIFAIEGGGHILEAVEGDMRTSALVQGGGPVTDLWDTPIMQTLEAVLRNQDHVLEIG